LRVKGERSEFISTLDTPPIGTMVVAKAFGLRLSAKYAGGGGGGQQVACRLLALLLL
jgi:hypothetical protein